MTALPGLLRQVAKVKDAKPDTISAADEGPGGAVEGPTKDTIKKYAGRSGAFKSARVAQFRWSMPFAPSEFLQAQQVYAHQSVGTGCA